MGVIGVPFESIGKAKEFTELMADVFTKNDLNKLYSIWFDDTLWDEAESFNDTDDLRPFIKSYLEKQLKLIKFYLRVDEEAVLYLKAFLKEK